MRIVIEIPDEIYQDTVDGVEDADIAGVPVGKISRAIANGIPLPKGHGDLISKEQAIDLVEFYQLNPQHFDFVNLIDEIKDEKPIIEADTESEGKE